MPGSTNYPASLDSHTGGNPFGFAEAINRKATTLDGALNNSATTITVVSTTGFPTRGLLSVGNEVVTYTGTTATTFTGVTRGTGGTSAVSHPSGEWVANVPTAANHNDLAAAIVATQTKLGTGASTAAANQVLRGTGAGVSAFGQITNTDFANFTATAFTPTVTQSGSITVSVTYAKYITFGKLIHLWVQLAVTDASAAVGNNPIIVTLPTSSPDLTLEVAGNYHIIGPAFLLDAGTAFLSGVAVAVTSSTVKIARDGKSDYLGTTTDAVTLANNDVISFAGTAKLA